MMTGFHWSYLQSWLNLDRLNQFGTMNMRDITSGSITCHNECTTDFHQRYNKLFHALNDQLRIYYSVSNFSVSPNCTNGIESGLLKGVETS
ncbi:hypothetical protein EUGRSUZ_F02559 [Eucalyptus grandis]|uniref:Uncharacterized protein n=2 Tax=Eucalyptus grandis TaxID=71139 RepID=A0ACC3KIC7_EUCGR|nr:hypothetical protein EUGRSUZ_F02559 [Eucalyptus grandis]